MLGGGLVGLFDGGRGLEGAGKGGGRYSMGGMAFSCGFEGGVVGGSSGGGVSIGV